MKLSTCWWISSVSLSKLLPILFAFPRHLHSYHSNRQFASSRYHNIDMKSTMKPIEIGLTGSIGMGKSTITKQFRRLGFPVFDADDAVHQLYSSNGEAVAPLRSLFPNAIVNDVVDRKELMKYIMQDSSTVKEIEKIVHPLVIAKREKFLIEATERRELLIVYDIPLLFENEYRFDYTIVVTADPETQKARVLSRPGMTQEKFESILSKQLSDDFKRKHADYLIFSNYESYVEGRAQLANILEDIFLKKESDKFRNWCTSVKTVTASSPTTAISAISAAVSASSEVSSVSNEVKLTEVIDAVVFDLDDTLVPVAGPISAAAMKLHELSHQILPKTMANHGTDLIHKVRDIMHQLKKESPLISHDLTEMRSRSLYNLAKQHDEHEQVGACIEEFLRVRSQVSEYLYPDTVECLEKFQQQGLKLGILTNGNAYLQEDKEFAKYFSLFLTASDVGAAKPSPVGFVSCCQHLQVCPSRVLYVGDSYDKDMIGAKAVGMKTALLFRPEEQKDPNAPIPLPDHHVDIVISTLNPDELAEKCMKVFKDDVVQ